MIEAYHGSVEVQLTMFLSVTILSSHLIRLQPQVLHVVQVLPVEVLDVQVERHLDVQSSDRMLSLSGGRWSNLHSFDGVSSTFASGGIVFLNSGILINVAGFGLAFAFDDFDFSSTSLSSASTSFGSSSDGLFTSCNLVCWYVIGVYLDRLDM